MTIEEAKVYLPHADRDELLDIIDEKLFEFQQFFLTKAPIVKVWNGRVAKLERYIEALGVLGHSLYTSNEDTEFLADLPDNVSEAFSIYNQKVALMKIRISSSKDFLALKNAVRSYLEFQLNYQQLWRNDNLELNEEVILGKEPDVMELVEAIKEFNLNGGETFSDIPKLGNEVLLKEMKRVSLLLKIK